MKKSIQKENTNRDLGNDILRGLAIVCVVLTHTTAEWGNRFSENSIYRNSYSIFRPILVIWAPIFLFISGYYIGRTKINNLKDYWTFLKKRMSRILIPYVICSTVLFIWGFFSGKYRIIDFPLGILLGRLNYPYYFVTILVKFYMVYPILYFCAKKGWIAAITFCFSLLLYIYTAIGGDPINLNGFWLTNILLRHTVRVQLIVFFIAGILIQNGYLSNWTKIKPKPRRIFSLALCVFTFAVSLIYNKMVALFAMSLILCINSYASEKLANRFTRALAYFGERSYTIYLLHEPSLGFAKRLILMFIPIFPLYPIIEQIPLTAVALSSPLMQAWIMQKLIGSKAKYIVG